jgi:hypothetical protein
VGVGRHHCWAVGPLGLGLNLYIYCIPSIINTLLHPSTWYQRTRLGLGFLAAAGCPKPHSHLPRRRPGRLIPPSRGGLPPSSRQPHLSSPSSAGAPPAEHPCLMSPWSSVALLRAAPVRAPSSARRPSPPAHGGATGSPFPGFAQGAGADFPAGGLLLPAAASPAPPSGAAQIRARRPCLPPARPPLPSPLAHGGATCRGGGGPGSSWRSCCVRPRRWSAGAAWAPCTARC